jgi:hypothetical protein
MEGTRVRRREVAIISTHIFFSQGGQKLCRSCMERAEIFEAEGDFFLGWQQETHPDV